MQNWSLDEHPTLVKFRKVMDTIPNNPNRFYHLFLCPPYAYPAPHTLTNQYLFYSVNPDKDILICDANPDIKLKHEKGSIYPISGFPQKFRVTILLTTFCSSMSGLNFDLHEIDNDIFDLSHEMHPLHRKVMECYQSYEKSVTFIEKTFEYVPNVINLYKGIDNAIFKTNITPMNREDFMQRMQISIEQLATEIFKSPDIEFLPVFSKQKLNYLIFNAITSKAHFKFVMAYNEAFAREDAAAQKYMFQHISQSKADKEKMASAAKYLHGILHLKSPCDQIVRVSQFFEAVVSSLPGTDVAADDILPAICSAMTLDYSFASHVVSFFTYLSEIWPSSGLDEKLSYILITCSIASAHISKPPPKEDIEVPKAAPAQQAAPVPKDGRKSTDQETISMLEDLLSQL